MPTVATTWHGSVLLSATTVDFSNPYGLLIVKNRGAADIYVRVDGTTPVALADGTYVVMPGEIRAFTPANSAAPQIKLIAAIAGSATVESPL